MKEGELSVNCGEEVTITDQSVGEGWWYAVNVAGQSGLVPSSYAELLGFPEPEEPPPPPPPPPSSYSTADLWGDDSDNDVNIPESNAHSLRSPSISYASPTTRSHSKTSVALSGSAPAADSIRLVIIRKGFPRNWSKSGADDFLLQLDPPTALSTEATIDYNSNMFNWRPSSQQLECQISSFQKNSKLKGMKSFIEYQITSSLVSSHVNRRYKQFDWLHTRLQAKYPCICIPPLPDKVITGRYEDEFVDERRRWLQQWLFRMCKHPVVSQSDVFKHFLSGADTKHWKQGKRVAEVDRYQNIRFYYAVDSKDHPMPEDYSLKRVEAAEKFSADMERSIRCFSDSLTEFHRNLVNQNCKDFNSLSIACKGVKEAMERDVHSNQLNTTLVKAIGTAQECFRSVSLYHAVQSDATGHVLDFSREMTRLFALLPNVVGVARAASTVSEEAQRHASDDRLSNHDNDSIQSGVLVITRSVQAESNHCINIFRTEFVQLMHAYLRDRARFYRHLADQMDAAASAFQC